MLPIPLLMQVQPGAQAPVTTTTNNVPAGGGLLEMLLLPVGMIVIFYFLLIRPQNNRMKKHRELIANIKKGDKVITQGGIIGRVFKLTDEEVTIDTGEGGKLRIMRGMIMDVKKTDTPANDTKES